MSSKSQSNKHAVIEWIVLFVFFLTEVFTTLTMLLLWHRLGLGTELYELLKILFQ